MVDRFRLLVNNLHTVLSEDTLTIALEPDAITVEISFQSNDPTLRAEGRAYLVWFFGIPVGWQDAAFPDINISDFRIQLRLSPYVSGGKLALSPIGVVFSGHLHTDAITSHLEQEVRNGIRSAFESAINMAEIRELLAFAIEQFLLSKLQGVELGSWTDLWIEDAAIVAQGRPK
jgi:hypothetical protein